jgi:hypothetical protein
LYLQNNKKNSLVIGCYSVQFLTLIGSLTPALNSQSSTSDRICTRNVRLENHTPIKTTSKLLNLNAFIDIIRVGGRLYETSNCVTQEPQTNTINNTFRTLKTIVNVWWMLKMREATCVITTKVINVWWRLVGI